MTAEDIEIIIAGLPSLSKSELKRKWAQLFGTHCYSEGRDFLIRRITWRLRNEYKGGLSDRAKERAKLICDEALIRLRPRQYQYQQQEDTPQQQESMSVIKREYKGEVHEVIVLSGWRYAYQGTIYDKLTLRSMENRRTLRVFLCLPKNGITRYIAQKAYMGRNAVPKTSGNKFFNLSSKARSK